MSVGGAALNLGNLNINVTIDTRSADAAFTKLGAQLTTLDNAFSKMGSQLNNLGSAFQSNTKHVQTFHTTLQQSVIVGAAFEVGVIAMRAALRGLEEGFKGVIGSAVGWSTTLNTVQANTTMTTADIVGMDAAIRSMAASSPANMEQLASAYRHAANEGYGLADSQKIVQAAMESAVSTGADVGQVVNSLATTMKIFRIDTADAGKAMDVLHLAAAQGNMTLEEFVSSSGKALSTSANLGASLLDTAAGLSALTRNGFAASEAGTQLTGILTHVVNPAKEAQAEIAKLSASTGVDLVRDFSSAGLKSRGLAAILGDLQKVVEITGDSSIVLKLIPALRGGQGALALTGVAANDYKTILESLQAVVEGRATPTADAYARTLNTVGAQFAILKNIIGLIALQIGTVLLPVLKAGIELLTQFGNAIGQVFNIPGLDKLAQGQKEHNEQIERGKTLMTDMGKTQEDTAAKAKAGADAAAVSQEHIKDALDAARVAAGALNEALGLANGTTGAAAAAASIGQLEQLAGGDATRALADLNAALTLPDGPVALAAVNAALADMKIAGTEVTMVIQNLDRQLASVKSSMDEVRNAQNAAHDIYDPIMKGAQQQMAANDRPNYARLAQEANLNAEHARLAGTRPDISQYTESIKGWEGDRTRISDAATRRNDDTGGYNDQIAGAQQRLNDMGTFDQTGSMANAVKASEELGTAHKQNYSDQIKTAQDAWTTASQGYADRMDSLRESGTKTAGEYGDQVRSATEAGRLAAQSLSDSVKVAQDAATDAAQAFSSRIDAVRETGRSAAQSLGDNIKSLKDIATDAAQAFASRIDSMREAGRKAAQSLSDDIKSLHDAATDAAQGFQNRIDAVKENGRAAAQAYDDVLVGLREQERHVGEGATDGVDSAITKLRDHIASLNTDALDDKINRLRDALNAPPPNTTGLTNQLAVLAAQIQHTTNVAQKSELEKQFAAIGAQKAGVERGYLESKTNDTAALKLLENEKRDAVNANKDTKRGDESQIRDLEAQRKVILDNVADQKKALADQIAGQELLKRKASETNADAVRAIEVEKKAAADGYAERVRQLEEQKTAIERNTADTVRGIEAEKKAAADASAENIRQLEEQKTGIERNIADVVRGIEVEKKAAADTWAEKIKAIEAEKTQVERATSDRVRTIENEARTAADTNKKAIDAIKDEEIAGKRKSDANITNLKTEQTETERIDKLHTDELKKNRSNAERDFKARQEEVKSEIKGIQSTRDEQDRADKVQLANLRDKIADARTLSDNLMAPWKQQEEANNKAMDALKILDDQDKAARDIANLPLHKVYDDAKLALDAMLEPLAQQQHALDEQQRTLTEEKARWQGIKSAIDSAKSSADAYAKASKAGAAAGVGGDIPPANAPGGLGGPPTYAGMTNPADMPRTMVESPWLAPLRAVKEFIDTQLMPALGAVKDWFIGTGFPTGKVWLSEAITGLQNFIKWLGSGSDGSYLFKAAVVVVTAAVLAYEIAVKGAATAQAILDAAMGANKFGLIVAAVVAVAAALVYLYNTNEDFRNAVNTLARELVPHKQLFEDIGVAVVAIATGFGALKVATVAYEVAVKLASAASWLYFAAQNAVDTLLDASAIKWVLLTAKTVLHEVATKAVSLATTLYTAAQTAATFIMDGSAARMVVQTVAFVAHAIAVKAVEVATTAYTAVQWLLNAAMTANPIGLVIAAIVALIAIFVLLYNNNKGFHDFVQDHLLPILKSIGTFITDTVIPALGRFGAWVVEQLPKIGAFFDAFGTTVHDWMAPGTGKIPAFFDHLGTKAGELRDTLKGIFGEGGTIGQFFSSVGTKAHEIFGEGGTIQTNLEALKTNVGNILNGSDGIGSKFEFLGTTVRGWEESGWVAYLSTALTNLGTFRDNVGTIIGMISGHFTSLATAVGNAFNGIGSTIADGLQGGMDAVGNLVHGVQHAINAIGGLFGNPTLGGTDWPVPNIATSSAPGGVGPPAPLGGATAEGTANWRGGITLIGEAGRELYAHGGNVYLADHPQLLDLPAGAQVFKHSDTERMLSASSSGPNAGIDIAASLTEGAPMALAGLGGPVEAWNAMKSAVGGFFSGAGSTAQSALSAAGGTADAIVKKAFDAAGVTAPSLPGVLGSVGGGMLDTLTKAVVEGVKQLLGLVPGGSTGGSSTGGGAFGGGGGMQAVRGLIDMEARRHGIPEDVLAAIVLQESSGIVGRKEDGGGFGRGLMQVDIGQHPGKYDEARLLGTTWDDAMYQMESGIEILNANAPKDWNNPAQLREALYHYNGSYAYSDIIKGLMPQFADWKNDGNATGSAGGDQAALTDALRYVGQSVVPRGMYSGQAWDYLCEVFNEMVGEDLGFGYRGAATAAARGRSAGLTRDGGIPPAGMSTYWDESFFPGAGHVAISRGDGSFVSTHVGGVSDHYGSGWLNGPGYMGYAPVSAANGAVTTTPTLLMTGDIGRGVPEITTPQPMMAQTFRDVLAERGEGGTTTINFNAGAIVAAPGMNTHDLATQIITEIDRRTHSQRRGRGMAG